MSRILPEFITIEPVDVHLAIIRFLEKYNSDLQSPDINGLLGDLTQFHIAQGVHRMWLETFREVLIESGALKETD